MKEGIFFLVIFLSIISVCLSHQTSYGYSDASRKRYNYACVNAVAVANRAFYQLANNLRHQINQDIVYSDLDSIYGLSYYLDSTCSEDELVLRVQGDENPACKKLFKLINLSLNQHGLDSFVNDYEKGINLSLQALKLGKSLNNDCKIKLVQKGEYDYDFDDLDSLDENINKQISKSDKYYAPSDDDLDLDLGDDQTDDSPVIVLSKPKANKPNKPSTPKQTQTQNTVVSPATSSVTSPASSESQPEKPTTNSWFPQKSDAGFGFLSSQNSPSVSTGSSSSTSESTPGTSSQAGFGQSASFMGNGAGGQSSPGAGAGGAQNGASQYYSQYYQAGGDPGDYNKYIEGGNAETQKDPSLLAAVHQNKAKTLNDESKKKYAGDSPDYSSNWQQYVGNYTSNTSSSSGQQGGQTYPFGDWQQYKKYNNDNKDKDEDQDEDEDQDDVENGEYSSSFLEDDQDQDQDQDDDSDSGNIVSPQEIEDLKDQFDLLF